MYLCQRCGKDASLEAQAEIDQVADSLSLGQPPYGIYEYFEQRYVCKACQAASIAEPPEGSAASHQDKVPAAVSAEYKSRYRHNIGLGELVRILTLVDSPPGFRDLPRPGDQRDKHFDAWFDGGAITAHTGGLSEYWFADGVRLDWAGLAPLLLMEVEWPDGRRVTISQTDPTARAAEVAQTKIGGDRKKIGRYEVTGPLGEWMYGPVYAGVDPASGRRVAIKTLLKRAQDEGFAAPYYMHLLREAQVGKRVKHPGIVQVLEHGEDCDVAYVTLEFLDARKLETYFDESARFRAHDVATIMGDLCVALEAVHEAGIVHSNLQPTSVVITVDGSAKLTDFGEAYLSDPDSHMNERELTESTRFVPTPYYRSPEAISGDVIDRRADLFSAGILLYRMATGQNPFPGTSPWTVAKRILDDDPLPPSALNSELSAQFNAVVAKALAKDPADRYQTARELNAALQAGLK